MFPTLLCLSKALVPAKLFHADHYGQLTAWGYASKNCRLYYWTHDLVPLLIGSTRSFRWWAWVSVPSCWDQVVTSDSTALGGYLVGVHRSSPQVVNGLKLLQELW